MESKIFNAARFGKLNELKAFLNFFPQKEVTKLISSHTNGATPLLIACRKGLLDVASYLIEKCQADVEQVGSTVFEDDVVPPLYCAAACGDLNLVKLLVRNKAIVNSTTKKKNFTPLLRACINGHFDVIKYLIQQGADVEITNFHGDTCIMATCYEGYYEISKYLVECGADVNRTNINGYTALHYCVESHSLEILKFLLENGAKLRRNSSGFTPLLLAAVRCRETIVEYFIQEYECTKQEKVNALEILGATFVDEDGDIIKSLDCWRRAMVLRHEDSENLLEIPRSSLSSYVDAIEVRTFAQLEELISDPDEVKIQALLVRERILGPDHSCTTHYVRRRVAKYFNEGNSAYIIKCLRLSMYALDVEQKLQPFTSKTQASLSELLNFFSYLMSFEGWPLDRKSPFVTFQDLLNLFVIALKEIENSMKLPEEQRLNDGNQFYLYGTLIITLKLVHFMCAFQTVLDKVDELELKKTVYQFVRMNPRTKDGSTPLHLACSNPTLTFGKYTHLFFPYFEVVQLLVEVGADPNAVDVHNNTPLHILAKQQTFNVAVIKVLLDHGAHLDLCNSDKQTPLQLLQVSNLFPLRYLNLECLCAQVVRKYNIPYKEFVDKRLEAFLDGH